MSNRMQNPDHLRNIAYPDSSRLNARTEFWQRFGLNADQWYGWYFGHFSPPASARILEVGCGPGGMWDWGLANSQVSPTWDVTLSDLSEGMVSEARDVFSPTGREFTYRVADVCELPFTDGSFDVVVANYMLYHASEPGQAASEISRVLTPDGSLYAATNSESHIKEIVDLQRQFATTSEGAVYASSTHEAFTLENGQGILSEHFQQTEVHAGESMAEADDVGLLVAFVESLDVDVDAARLTDHLKSHIDRHGCFTVTRSSGLLVATHPTERAPRPGG